MPHIGGADIAGTVEALGPGVRACPRAPAWWSILRSTTTGTRARTRDAGFERRPLRLLGEHTQGGFAEYAVVPAANLLAIPEGFASERPPRRDSCS